MVDDISLSIGESVVNGAGLGKKKLWGERTDDSLLNRCVEL